MDVNQQPVLCQSTSTSKPGQRMGGLQMEKHAKKNGTGKARRDWERHRLERIGRLSKALQQQWAKKEVLGLGGTIFLIDGRNSLPHQIHSSRLVLPIRS